MLPPVSVVAAQQHRPVCRSGMLLHAPLEAERLLTEHSVKADAVSVTFRIGENAVAVEEEREGRCSAGERHAMACGRPRAGPSHLQSARARDERAEDERRRREDHVMRANLGKNLSALPSDADAVTLRLVSHATYKVD